MHALTTTDIQTVSTTDTGSEPRERPVATGIPDAPLLHVEVSDPAIGLEGYVCIHSLGKYGASGGMRCVPDVSKTEVGLLAKAMTYKYAFFQIQQGGAKAGLRIADDADPRRRTELIREAARHLRPLIAKDLWSPWTDMNFFGRDLASFYDAIGISYLPGEDGGSSRRTALSAHAALLASLEWLDIPPHEARIAVEGFGSVARYLVPMLARSGIRLVALSNLSGCLYDPAGLDLDMVARLQRRETSRWTLAKGPWKNLPREAIFEIGCDVFVPGARVHTMDARRAESLPARLALPIANVPCTDDALAVLDRRGIVYVPDYIVNGGGVCGHIRASSATDPDGAFVAHYKPMVRRLLEAAARRGVPARLVSDEVAARNYGAIVDEAYDETPLRDRLLRRLHDTVRFLPGDPDRRERDARAARTLAHLEALFR